MNKNRIEYNKSYFKLGGDSLVVEYKTSDFWASVRF